MTLANKITLVRLFLIPVFVALVLNYTSEHPWIRYGAFAVYLVASISDAVDGFVARAYNQKSRLGAVLDPLADKLMINIGFVFLAVNEQFAIRIPMWLPVVILARDILIVAGCYIINEFYGPVRIHPRISGKLSTVFQMGLMITVLLEWQITHLLIKGVLVLCVVSWLDYMYAGIRQVYNEEES